MPELVQVSEIQESVCKITLNRPEKKNALSIALRDELTSALESLADNDAVKVVEITGSGAMFSAGFDLQEFEQAAIDEDFAKKLWDSSDRFHHMCLFFPLPLIATVNGPAIAGGFDLAVMCDIRIACREAYFSHPEITFGPVVYSPLCELVGGAVARDLCLTGRKIEADEALAFNLISRLVDRDRLGTESSQIASLITRASRDNLLRTKAKIIERAGLSKEATLDF